MLKTLCNLDGVSSNEDKVRDFIIEKITPYATKVEVDTMGNVIAFKKGKTKTERKIMVCAHMDEVGFIITAINEDGSLKFEEVGGLDERTLLTQAVRCENTFGILGIKAVHLQSKDERQTTVKMKNMYIDIGAKDKKEAEKVVSVGDYFTFDSSYEEFGNGFICAKALDDRVGCYEIINAIKKDYDEDIYFCFTTQEEVGLRGASALAHRINPNICIVLECTTALDIPFTKEHEKVTRLGRGVALSVIDRRTIYDKNLNKFVMNLAKKNGVKYQLKQAVAGGNDAGAISINASGCAVCVLSVPSRNIHSPVCVVHKDDIKETEKLLDLILENLSEFKED
ncbi:MAG: M42 family metallopeptidase [Ruminococcaceae bacterium]|nr:M42 family metallopeptidase [Oscillospiraceae bacterium]